MSKKRKKCKGKYKNGKPCRRYEPCTIHGENKQIEQHKKNLLEALELSKGIVSTACEKANLSRGIFYKYQNEDEEFASAVKEIGEFALDFTESKLFELIEGVTVKDGVSIYQRPPCKTSIIFYLKTKGKERGYVERQEIDANVKAKLDHNINNEIDKFWNDDESEN